MQTKFRYTLVRDMCMQRTGALGVDEFLRDSVASGRDCCPENKRKPTVRKRRDQGQTGRGNTRDLIWLRCHRQWGLENVSCI